MIQRHPDKTYSELLNELDALMNFVPLHLVIGRVANRALRRSTEAGAGDDVVAQSEWYRVFKDISGTEETAERNKTR